jgi:WD40 repeat protein/ribosomal protein L7/L12
MTKNGTISQQALLLALNGHNAVAAPYFQSMRPHNVHPEVKQFFGGLPDYEELFGSGDNTACDHDRSLFSPAAYFVDLMRFIDMHIEAPEGLRLRDRRPDLFELPLDMEHTTGEKPFLQLVNQVLIRSIISDTIQGDDLADPDHIEDVIVAGRQALLSEMQYETQPWSLPYNHALAQIRAYLKHLGTDLASIVLSYFFNGTPYGTLYEGELAVGHDSAGKINWIFFERLNLSRLQLDLLTDDDNSLVSTSVQSGSEKSSSVASFLRQTGLTRGSLDDLIKQVAGNGFLNNRTKATVVEDAAERLKLQLLGQPSLKGHDGAVLLASFSPDGQRIVTAGEDGTAKVWDLAGNILHTLEGHGDDVINVSFSPDGQHTMTVSENRIIVWDMEGNELVKVHGNTTTANFSPDGQSIVIGTTSGEVYVRDFEGNVLRDFTAHGDEVTSAIFSPNGTYLLTAGKDGETRLWWGNEAEGDNIIDTIDGSSVSFAPGGNYVLTDGDTLRYFGAGEFGEPHKLEYSAGCNSTCFSPDLDHLVTAHKDGSAKVWDVEGNELHTLQGHKGAVCWASFSSDGQRIVTASEDGTAKVWDLKGNVLLTLGGHSDEVLHASFSPDGQRVVTASRDGSAKVWIVGGEKERLELGNESFLYRFILLAQQIGWSFTDLNWALTSVDVQEIDNQTMHNLVKVKSAFDRFGLPIDELTCFWHDMMTNEMQPGGPLSQADANYGQDLYCRVFGQPYSEMTYTLRDVGKQGNTVRPWLLAALKVSDVDLSKLVAFHGKHSNPRLSKRLSITNLTYLYRLKRLSELLERSVNDTLLLLELLDNELQTLDDFLAVVAYSDWLAAAGYSVAQLDYLASDSKTNYCTDIKALPADLRQALAEATKNNTEKQQLDVLLEKLASLLNTRKDTLWRTLELQFGGTKPAQSFVRDLVSAVHEEDAQVWKDAKVSLNDLARHLYGAELLQLSADELSALKQNASWFGIENIQQWTKPHSLWRMHAFKQLQKELKDTEGGLLALFSLVEKASDESLKWGDQGDATGVSFATMKDARIRVIEQTATLTGWSTDSLTDLMSWTLTEAEKDDETEEYVDPEDLYEIWGEPSSDKVSAMMQLKAQFDLANQLGTSHSFLAQLSRDVDSGNELVPGAYALLDTIKAKYDEAQWQRVRPTIMEPLDAKLRDTLVEVLLHRLNKDDVVTNHFGRIDTPADLYDYLLIDVENSGCAAISPIKQGLNTLQLYIHRCRNRLEPWATSTIPEKQWEWMSHYRVWEANRKVFFYPENYLDPELRQEKSPEFSDLQAELLQGELTTERVTKAYNDYFQKIENLSRLKIVSSYYTTIAVPEEGRSENRLYLFGRSHTSPPVYYMRSAEIADDRDDDDKSTPVITRWHPWQRLELTINAPALTAIHAFDRLFVFWVEQKKETRQETIAQKQKRVEYTLATVKYSFQNVNGSWVQPQTVSKLSDLEIAIALQDTTADIARLKKRLVERYKTMSDSTYQIPIMDKEDLSAAWDSIVGKKNSDLPAVFVTPTESFTQKEFIDNYVKNDNQEVAYNWLDERITERAIQQAHKAVNIATGERTELSQLFASYMFEIKPSVEKAITPEIRKIFLDTKSDMATVLKEIDAIKEWPEHFPAWTVLQDGHENALDWTSVYAVTVPASGTSGERIVIAYGAGKVPGPFAKLAPSFFAAQLESDLRDQKCYVEFRGVRQSYWGGIVYTPFRASLDTLTLGYGVYFSEVDPANNNYKTSTPSAYWPGEADSEGFRLVLKQFAGFLAAVIPVGNQPGWAIFDKDDEQFLILTHGLQNAQVSSSLKIFNESVISNSPNSQPESVFSLQYDRTTKEERIADTHTPQAPDGYAFIRLGSTTIDELSRRMFAGGVERLLNLEAQWTAERDFQRFQPVKNAVAPPDTLDFSGPFGIYFWESFFHIPSLVASTYNANQKFKEAQNWYQTIFNPTVTTNSKVKPVLYWPLNEGPNSPTLSVPQWQRDTDLLQGYERWIPVGFNHKESIIKPIESMQPFAMEGWFKLKEDQFTDDKRSDYILDCYDPFFHLEAGRNRLTLKWIHKTGHGALGDGTISLLDESFRPDEPLPGQWHHAAITFDDGVFSVYLDGKTVIHTTVKDRRYADLSPTISEFRCGSGGSMAEVKLWDYALSEREIDESYSSLSGDRFWQYKPFRHTTQKKLFEMITNPQALTAYENDPFDPHALARLRIGAYEKSIVMRYIDNLLDWGDNLFSQDSWESIAQATMLLVEARDLLGKRPHELAASDPAQSKTFDQLANTESEFWVTIESALKENAGTGAPSPTTPESTNYLPFEPTDLGYFCLVENEEFTKYWDRVDDRLYKIRHCLNIKGVERQLALFQPPIDPRQLIRALASGESLGDALKALDEPVLHYRFAVMLQQAKTIAATVIQLGAGLLAALEKKDASAMALLRVRHEKAVLDLTTRLRERQVEEAQQSIAALQSSKATAELRREHYAELRKHGLNQSEKVNEKLMGSALEAMEAARLVRMAAVEAHLIPTIFGMSDGDFQPGSSVSEAATLSDAFGGIRSHRAAMAATMGQNTRRTEDWELQERLAVYDITQIEQQIEAAKIRQAVAERSLEIHDQSIEHAKEMEVFLKSRFGNEELYGWIVKRLGTIYRDSYYLAVQQARSAEVCYRYECNTDDTLFIQSSYSDSLHMRLLAGEELMAALNHMEAAYRENHAREYEIEKTISLRQLLPDNFSVWLKDTGPQKISVIKLLRKLTDLGLKEAKELTERASDDSPQLVMAFDDQDSAVSAEKQLREAGANVEIQVHSPVLSDLRQGKVVKFPLTERLFDLDFPGHYCRKIKTIALTIPAVVGPYQNVQATLTQTKNRTLLKPDKDGVQFLLPRGEGGENGSDKNIRSNMRQAQQIAISRGINDSGLFELNFHDERYLPFEGTGAVSDWEFEMPPANNRFDFNSISDVIIHLRYTALDGSKTLVDGKTDFRTVVNSLVQA